MLFVSLYPYLNAACSRHAFLFSKLIKNNILDEYFETVVPIFAFEVITSVLSGTFQI